jgi:trehalose-phosphatase
MTRHLFAFWQDIAKRLEQGRTIALFCDFDGTLVRLESHPDMVVLDPATRHALTALVRSRKVLVWIVSGRRRQDILSRIRVAGIQYLGLHGWEGAIGKELPFEAAAALAEVRRSATDAFAQHASVWVEDKRYSLAIHHPSDVAESTERALRAIVAPFASTLSLVEARRVWEVVPLHLEDKGVAVRRQMAALSHAAVPVYLGDDLIDEPAFEAIPGGITVRVGPARRTKARYRLSSVREVRYFLQRLAAEFA